MRYDSMVLVPWDFSEHSRFALEYTLKCTAPEKIHVLCVLERPNIYSAGILWDDHAEDIARAKCEKQFAVDFEMSNCRGLSFTAEFGEPAAEIVRVARNIEAEAIVISSHGRSGITRLMLGSVAQQVAQKAGCPVTLLPNAFFESSNGSSKSEGSAESISE